MDAVKRIVGGVIVEVDYQARQVCRRCAHVQPSRPGGMIGVQQWRN
jgi:hypothetical protein